MSGMVRLVVFLWCAASSVAAEPDWLMAHVRSKILRNLATLPNYTCLQTIERSIQVSPRKKARVLDRIRLEVAVVHGKELFAWPGSRRFLDTEIADMVGGGAISTGAFALLAKSIFQSSAAQFTYIGEVDFKKRKAHQWDFTVPQMLSKYTLRVGDREAVVGYHGSFWADAESLDLLAITSFADGIPPHLELDAASDMVEYTQAKIGEEMFLLPAMAELRLVSTLGPASVNRTEFGSCRRYSGESTLLFDDPDLEGKQAQPERVLNAPAGLEFEVVLETDIRHGEHAIGDPVIAKLVRPLKIGTGITAPKGAAIRGRLTYLAERTLNRYPGFDVGLDFYELQWDNTLVNLRMRLMEVMALDTTSVVWPSARRHPDKSNPEGERIDGSIFFVRRNNAMPLRLHRGTRMLWRTIEFESEEHK
jgi:hypothetical protein